MKRMLFGFGFGLFIVDAPIYLASRSHLLWHGRVQLGMAAVGAACMLVAVLWRKS